MGVNATRENLAGARNGGVARARGGDGIQKNDHVLLVLDEALCLFDDHFRDLNVTCRRLVEGRGYDFTPHRALHFRDFFRALVDEQDDEHDFRIIGRDRLRDVLQHQRLARFRR